MIELLALVLELLLALVEGSLAVVGLCLSTVRSDSVRVGPWGVVAPSVEEGCEPFRRGSAHYPVNVPLT